MKQVILLVGSSGSGKSTWVQEVLASSDPVDPVVVSADHYFVQPDGTYRFDGTKLAQAHAACKKSFLLALQRGANVVFVDNTNTRRWERKEYVQEALNAGYEVWLKVFDTPPEVCAERNTHGVPLAACQKMAARIDVPVGFYQIKEA